MRLTTEAVLDHFTTTDVAATGTCSATGIQLRRASIICVDSTGRKIRLTARRYAPRERVRAVTMGKRYRDLAALAGRAPIDHHDPDGESFYAPDGELRSNYSKVRDAPDPARTSDRVHDEIITRAERERCARAFRSLHVIDFAEVPTIRVLAREARMHEGEAAAQIIAEHQRWVQTDAAGKHGDYPTTNEGEVRASREQFAEACVRVDRHYALAERAVGAVETWARRVAPHAPPTTISGASLYREALAAIDAWVTRSARDAKAAEGRDVWMPITEVAIRTGMPERTLQHQCKRGELPARKRPSAKGAPTWWLNLTACALACEDPDAATDALQLLSARARSSRR